MTDNIKQFLEADALRTQGEWVIAADSGANVWTYVENTHIANCQIEVSPNTAWANSGFIAAASRIAPDIRNLLSAFEQVCEALSRLGTIHEATLMDYEGMNAAGDSEDLRDVENALAAAAPYRKLMGGV